MTFALLKQSQKLVVPGMINYFKEVSVYVYLADVLNWDIVIDLFGSLFGLWSHLRFAFERFESSFLSIAFKSVFGNTFGPSSKMSSRQSFVST